MNKKIIGIILLVIVGYCVFYSSSYSHKVAETQGITQGGAIQDGEYRVGKDIPSGEYKLTNNDTQMGYFNISSDSTGSTESRIKNGNFRGNSYVTVKDGEYLAIKRCYAEKVN